LNFLCPKHRGRSQDWSGPLQFNYNVDGSRRRESERKVSHLYTGTLIVDLILSVERTEQTSARRSRQAGQLMTAAATRPSRSQAEQFPQPLCLSAADWNLALLLIIHAQLVGTFKPGHDFANTVNVHQVGAVSAPE
jgi:hypothetical protein